MSKTARHLVESFEPEHYTIFIDPDRDTRLIDGEVAVRGLLKGRPSQRLTLHQYGLTVTSARIIKHGKDGDQEIPVSRITHQRKLDEVRLHTDTMLSTGTYTIVLRYHGKITDTLQGIYPCNYRIDRDRKVLIATQFESHYAREALPCIDEPAAKATFQLTLASPLGETALSNTPMESQVEKDGKLHTTFETTPRMSTYLLAFVYGDMQSREAKTKDGVMVSAWSTKAHSLTALEHAVNDGVRGIEFLNEYYGVPYPLPKCDLVALPDFAVGAMENWGLVTFRERRMLTDPLTNPLVNRQAGTRTLMHELAHMWFGDLVTMQWWNDLWLSESFATVMAYVAIDANMPEWRFWNYYVFFEGLTALRRDAIPGVQPIEYEVKHPDEIEALFDPAILYAKGGRLLNMLMHYLGEQTFRRGLKLYFDKHAYGNATGDDLWAALGQASNQNVAGLMKPWLHQSGFPVLSVLQQDTSLSITQSHFLLDAYKADQDRRWAVPLFASAPEIPALLENEHLEMSLKSSDYVHLNQGAIGHYIVHYVNPEHAESLARLVATKQLTEAERLMLLNDSSMLARAGKQSFAATLQLLEHYNKEDGESVWEVIALIIADAKRFIDTLPTVEPALKSLVRNLIAAQYRRLGWKEHLKEPVQDTKLRAIILRLGLYADHSNIVAQALQLFDAYDKDPSVVPSELRSIVFTAAVANAHPGAFDYLLKLEEKTANVDLKNDTMAALAATRSISECKLLLARMTNPKKVRQHDIVGWVAYLLANRHTQTETWAWMRANWAWIVRILGRDKNFDEFPRLPASTFNTHKLMEEYKTFFRPKTDHPVLSLYINVGIEELEARIAWLERDIAAVEAFFKSK